MEPCSRLKRTPPQILSGPISILTQTVRDTENPPTYETESWHEIWSANTLKCLSIGTPKTINFQFVSNEKLMIFRGSNIQAHYNEAVIYLNFGTPKNDEFSIWNKWKIYYF